MEYLGVSDRVYFAMYVNEWGQVHRPLSPCELPRVFQLIYYALLPLISCGLHAISDQDHI